MSSILDPRGPLPPSVYWRRRILVLIVVIVVVALIWWLVSSLSGPSTPAATSPSISPTPTFTSPIPTVTTAPTTPSATASKTASPSPTAAIPLCTDAQIQVSAHPLASAYPLNGPVHIRYAVSTTASSPCRRDVGQIANSLVITSGGTRIWSSDDCNPGGSHDVRTLSQSASYVETVTWNTTISHVGCPSGAMAAPAGTYQVVGHNLSVSSPPETFTLG